jgi:hypothetical protein
MPISRTQQSMLPVVSSLPAGQSTSAGMPINLAPTSALTTVSLMITWWLTYGASGVTQPAVLEVFTSLNGTDFDTVPFKTSTMPYSAGLQRQTVSVEAGVQWVKVEVRNGDPSVEVTLVEAVGVFTEIS